MNSMPVMPPNFYPFAPNNPYQDNPAFLKKVFSRRYLLIMIVSSAVMLAAVVFGIFYCVSLLSEDRFYYSGQDTLLYNAFMSMRIMAFSVISILCAISFISFVILLNYSADKNTNLFPVSSLILNMIISFAVLIISGILFLILSSDVIIPLFMPDRTEFSEPGTFYIISSVLIDIFLLLMVLWSSGGIAFISSLKKTASCTGIYTAGSSFFSVMSFLLFLMNIIVGIAVLGIYFYEDWNESVFIVEDIRSLSMTAAIVFSCFFFGAGTAVFFTGSMAKRFRTAAAQALNSVRYSGVNQYVAILNAPGEPYYSSGKEDSAPPQTVFRN